MNIYFLLPDPRGSIATIRDHEELIVLHKDNEVGFYFEDTTHAEEGVKIVVRVRQELIYGNAMELAKVANHLRGRVPKSGLQLGQEDSNLVTPVRKAKLVRAWQPGDGVRGKEELGLLFF